MLKEGTSFNIAAACATELSRCDYSAELEIRRTEGEGDTTDEDENTDPITQSGYETLINASGVNLVALPWSAFPLRPCLGKA
jgi:hypothetical protein